MSDRELLVCVVVLLVVTLTAAILTAGWMIADWQRTRRGRMSRSELRMTAIDWNVQPHRFERYEHLRQRVRDAAMPNRGRAMGVRHHAR